MVSRSWKEAVSILARATGDMTPKQRDLVNMAGLTIPAGTPRIVVGALLKLAFAEELDEDYSQATTESTREYLADLALTRDPVNPQTQLEAQAWVKHFLLVRRREHLLDKKLKEGDIVCTADGEIAEVSSIGTDGCVYFKGGRGHRCWPDLVSVEARAEEQSDQAIDAKRLARNTAERRSGNAGLSIARSADLHEFISLDFVSSADIDELEHVILTANDERPIQDHLGKHGHLLTGLLGGKERYCLPQKRLGAEFVPDFVIGDVDSLGFRWVLIELETPNSSVYIKSGGSIELEKKARTGVAQIKSWRNWLSSNIAYARQRRGEDGLGLFDIREKADGLVLVGRRSSMPDTKDSERLDLRQSSNIQVHTNDWLIERLRGANLHQGPPVTNPYLIPHVDR